jgi:hypothetical protein
VIQWSGALHTRDDYTGDISKRDTTGRRVTMLKKVYILVFMFISTMGNTAYYCTVFTASVGGTVLFGNNEDAPETDSYAWFYPATETEYGVVYFGFGGYYAQGGMNDQGLCFDITTVPEWKMRPHPEKSSTLNFGERALELCATVEDVIHLVEKYNLSHLGMAQFLFADKTGDSVIVCPGIDGEMKTVRKEGIYQVATNFNVTYPTLGGYPCLRYNTATEMLEKIESEEDLTVGYFATILKAVSQNTSYSTIYDLRKGIICFFNQCNFSDIIVFNLEEELEKGYHSYYMPSFFTKETKPAEKPKFGGMEEPWVIFLDENLEQVILETIGKTTGPIFARDVEEITYLDAKGRGITRIEGLEYLKNLEYLDLGQNNLVNISPLTTLTNIRELALHENSISDISPLAALTGLEVLYLNNNSITDISPLVSNHGINSGDIIDISHNPLSEESIGVHIPELEKRGVNMTWKVERESSALLYSGVFITAALILGICYYIKQSSRN